MEEIKPIAQDVFEMVSRRSTTTDNLIQNLQIVIGEEIKNIPYIDRTDIDNSREEFIKALQII